MSLRQEVPPGKSGPGDATHFPHQDPRIAAFGELVDSFDRSDWKAGQLATRKLRTLGFGVILVKPPDGSAVQR
jgi:hypothetical protein